jgi:hypothetical protein
MIELFIFIGVWLLGIYPAVYLIARFGYNAVTWPEGENPRPGIMSNREMALTWGGFWPFAVLLASGYLGYHALKWFFTHSRGLGVLDVLDKAHRDAERNHHE